jgi:hypothetical protein
MMSLKGHKVKISIIDYLKLASSNTKAFNSFEFDEIYDDQSRGLTFSERKNVKQKILEFMEPIMIHLLMYCYPDKRIGSEETIKSNERELINKFLLKNTNTMIKAKTGANANPLRLQTPMSEIEAKKIITALKNKHEYTKLKFDYGALIEIRYIFLTHWSWFIGEKRVKGDKQATYFELAKMLKDLKKNILTSAQLKGFKLQD